MRPHWRRFRAKLNRKPSTGNTEDAPEYVARAHEAIAQTLGEFQGRFRRVTLEQLEPVINLQTERTRTNPVAYEWFALLLLRSPIAARAQYAADKHRHGSPLPRTQLYELIDFNDAFISSVLTVDQKDRTHFISITRREIDRFCKQLRARTFSDEQYEAITRGLTREVAVYLGAQGQGYEVHMTSRSQDALGIDLTVTDPGSGKMLSIDCKTPSAFRYRIQDLVREGRLSEDDAMHADQDGYAYETNGSGSEAVDIVLLRVDPNELGDIDGFEFRDPSLLGSRLKLLFGLLE